MNLPFHILAPMLAAAALALSPVAVRAQGIPVIDIANLIQTIQQVINELTQIDNQVQQIEQLNRQVGAITGARNLGSVFDAPALHNYVPASAYQVLAGVDASGYAGLTPTARALRDAQMLYNCLDLGGAARV